MLQKMLLETVWGQGIISICVAGILSRMITVLSYKRMQQAAEHPAKSKKPWVVLLKKRYESYVRFGKMKNVEAFVEHYFSRKGILGVPLTVWDKSGLFFAGAAGFLGVCAAAFSYNQAQNDAAIGYLLMAVLAGTGLILVHIVGDTTWVKRQILVALTDYLANSGGKRETMAGTKGQEKPLSKAEVDALDEAAVTEEERIVLEEVLEDYFW